MKMFFLLTKDFESLVASWSHSKSALSHSWNRIDNCILTHSIMLHSFLLFPLPLCFN